MQHLAYHLRNADKIREQGKKYKLTHPNTRYYKPCPQCGKQISPHAKLCAQCFGKMNRGANNYNWKGGLTRSMGYVLVRCPNHSKVRNGYVFEHVINWEKAHNESLPKGWHVHHLNGIKDDNRPANLVALPNRKHAHILAAKAKRIQELEALINGQSLLL